MEQHDDSRQEWNKPENGWGPAWLSLYHSTADRRLFVPKRIPDLGWTINLGHPRAMHSLALLSIILCLLPALVAGVQHWSTLASAPEPWWWLVGSLALAVAVAFLNGLRHYRLSWIPVALAFGAFAAVTGFVIQGVFNGPVVALLGATNLTWRSHLYLALIAALSQTTFKCLFLLLCWRSLQIGDVASKVRCALLVGLGFTVSEIFVVWSQSLWSGQEWTGWQLGILERGISSLFHIYSTGLLAVGLIRRNVLPFFLVIGVHYVTDWVVGANSTLLQLTVIQLEGLFFIPVVLLWMIFLVSVQPFRTNT